MEGFSCSEPDCNVCDYLPFFCPRCSQRFCLDHRSSFIHTCSPRQGDASVATVSGTEHGSDVGMNVKEMLQSVSNRHVSVKSSSIEHFKIATMSLPSKMQPSAKLVSKINSLEDAVTPSQKQQRINSKLKGMLIKCKSVGNADVAEQDRIYLIIAFAGMNNIHGSDYYLFFPRYISIGEMIQKIIQKYPQFVYNQNPPLGMNHKEEFTFVISTDYSPEWTLWNRSSLLGDVLRDFDAIYLQCQPLSVVVAAQERLGAASCTGSSTGTGSGSGNFSDVFAASTEDLTAATMSKNVEKTEAKDNAHVAAVAASNFSTDVESPYAACASTQLASIAGIESQVESASAAASVIVQQPVPNSAISQYAHEYRKGDLAWYSTSDGNLLVIIIAVHKDDFPNIYYTIGFPIDDKTAVARAHIASSGIDVTRERQTNGERLTPYERYTKEQADRATAVPAATFLPTANGLEGAASAAPVALFDNVGELVSFRITFGSSHQEVCIGSSNSIAQLRLLVAHKFGLKLIDVKRMKLVCKGVILKNDSECISSSKIVNGCKLSLIGSV
jgi:hypothetical protein